MMYECAIVLVIWKFCTDSAGENLQNFKCLFLCFLWKFWAFFYRRKLMGTPVAIGEGLGGEFNLLGSQGWEFVGVIPGQDDAYSVVFKRNKETKH